MKYYLEYLFENESAYRRAFFFTFLGFLFTSFFAIVASIKKPEYRISGMVESISKDEVARKHLKTGAIYYEDAIRLEVKGTDFFVVNNFKDKWNEVLKKVQLGETVSIKYYVVDDEFRIRHLEKDAEIILNARDLDKIQERFQLTFLILAPSFLFYLFLMHFKRKKYNKLVNTSYKPHDGGM